MNLIISQDKEVNLLDRVIEKLSRSKFLSSKTKYLKNRWKTCTIKTLILLGEFEYLSIYIYIYMYLNIYTVPLDTYINLKTDFFKVYKCWISLGFSFICRNFIICVGKLRRERNPQEKICLRGKKELFDIKLL